MTNPMLAELDEVVPRAWMLRIGDSNVWSYCEQEWMADFYGRKSGLKYEKQPLYDHATLADMAKRLEAAERDAAIGKAYKRWYAAAMGYRNIVADAAHRAIMRAAIDATQEGEG